MPIGSGRMNINAANQVAGTGTAPSVRDVLANSKATAVGAATDRAASIGTVTNNGGAPQSTVRNPTPEPVSQAQYVTHPSGGTSLSMEGKYGSSRTATGVVPEQKLSIKSGQAPSGAENTVSTPQFTTAVHMPQFTTPKESPAVNFTRAPKLPSQRLGPQAPPKSSLDAAIAATVRNEKQYGPMDKPGDMSASGGYNPQPGQIEKYRTGSDPTDPSIGKVAGYTPAEVPAYNTASQIPNPDHLLPDDASAARQQASIGANSAPPAWSKKLEDPISAGTYHMQPGQMDAYHSMYGSPGTGTGGGSPSYNPQGPVPGSGGMFGSK